MWLALGAVIAGLVVLVWSADRFVDGASATARHAGMPTLLVGMLVIGFWVVNAVWTALMAIRFPEIGVY